MRPTSRPQSAVRYPLNRILGTEVAVRLLRILMRSDVPIGIAELARQAELQASGVARVCERLEDLGVIEAVGRGAPGRQFRARTRFGLAEPLRALFTAESAWSDRIQQEIRDVVRTTSPQPRAAWIGGTVGEGLDLPGDVVVVGVLVESERIAPVQEDLRRRFLPVQREHDVAIEVRALTLADLKTMAPAEQAALERVRLLLGPAPMDLLRAKASPRGKPGKRTHQDLDSRSLAIGRRIAERLRKDPSLVEKSLHWIERRMPLASDSEQWELEEWRGLLDTMSVPRLRRFLVRDDARARRLRQSLPFLNVLTEDERRQLLSATGK